MKKRRFHITAEQGTVVMMALQSGIADVEDILVKEDSPYWRYIKIMMVNLYDDLKEYKWYYDNENK